MRTATQQSQQKGQRQRPPQQRSEDYRPRVLSDLIEEGLAAIEQSQHLGAFGGYFSHDPVTQSIVIDPILASFAGKFGGAASLQFIVEEFDHGDHYTRDRVYSREQIFERVTRAVIGGVPALSRRVSAVPKLYEALQSEYGWRTRVTSNGGRSGTLAIHHYPTFFRAIAYLTDTCHVMPGDVVAFLRRFGQ